jgi:hypothetical protein
MNPLYKMFNSKTSINKKNNDKPKVIIKKIVSKEEDKSSNNITKTKVKS